MDYVSLNPHGDLGGVKEPHRAHLSQLVLRSIGCGRYGNFATYLRDRVPAPSLCASASLPLHSTWKLIS